VGFDQNGQNVKMFKKIIHQLKSTKFFIPAEVSIAVILAGMSFLFFFAGLFLGKYPLWLKISSGVFVFFIIFILTIILIKIILHPIDKFIKKVSPIIEIEPGKEKEEKSEFKYEYFFNRLTRSLTQVEKEELFPNIICKSEIMRQILKQVATIASTDTTVLILGESGTGKELIAENIHTLSKRKNGPLIKVNCAALPKELIESELFGYEKGAFTGATSSKPGKFELAHKGTILLDEIGDLPLELQGKLLRVLEDKQVEKLGGKYPRPVDIRIIAATNKELKNMVQEGKFREDLYYRLSAFPLYLPPLRQRKEDIPLLAEYFLKQNFPQKKLSPKSLQVLNNYSWPGNVRELFNVLEQAALICPQEEILPEHLNISREQSPEQTSSLPFSNLDEHLQEIEKQLIVQALKEARGVQREAAKLLGIKERSLWHRVKKYALAPNKFK